VIRLGITGTDTGVGKTVVASTIAAGMRARGMTVAVMKPVETGVEPGRDPTDAWQLLLAAGSSASLGDVVPYVFGDPVAPWVASQRERRPIDIDVLDAAFERLSARADVVIVEGAGGLLVPITETEHYGSLFKRWQLDVVVVALNRLGVINHARLTVRELARIGRPVRAVVLNDGATPPADAAVRDNLVTLQRLLSPIAVVPFGRVDLSRTGLSTAAIPLLARISP
jgi:dethiobiotin synthetase